MNEEYNTPEYSLADDVDVTSSDGEGNDSIVSEAVNSASEKGIKDVLAETLGRSFKDNDSALKSVKDTFDYVGKVGKYKGLLDKIEQVKGGETNAIKFMEEIIETPQGQESQSSDSQISTSQPDVAAKVETLEQQLKESMFYAENPEYKAHKDLIASMGSNPEEVVKSEVFQKAFNALKANEEMENSKSVLHTNSRLGQVQDKFTQAKEALDAGNDTVARQNVVSAVLETFPGD